MAGLSGLYDEMTAFFRPLWPGEDKPLVLGEGNENAPELMLIGEAPGETEVIKRRPFVGKAGKNLDEFLQMLRLPREAIFVTNVVKIRPTEKGPTGRSRNRAPNREELYAVADAGNCAGAPARAGDAGQCAAARAHERQNDHRRLPWPMAGQHGGGSAFRAVSPRLHYLSPRPRRDL